MQPPQNVSFCYFGFLNRRLDADLDEEIQNLLIHTDELEHLVEVDVAGDKHLDKTSERLEDTRDHIIIILDLIEEIKDLVQRFLNAVETHLLIKRLHRSFKLFGLAVDP